MTNSSVNKTKRNIILAAALAIFTLGVMGLSRSDDSSTVKKVATTVVANSPTLVATASATKEILQLKPNANRSVFIFGEIGDTSAIVNRIYSLDKTEGSIYLIIDSPGGSVVSGAKVISAIEGAHNPVYTIDVGLAASMAAIIHSYGTLRYATDRSVLMYHDYAGSMEGYGAHMHSQLNLFDRYTQKMAAHIAERAGISFDTFYVGMLKQIWVDAEDATAQHFNDKIVALDVNSLLPKDDQEKAKLLKQLEEAKSKFSDLYDLE